VKPHRHSIHCILPPHVLKNLVTKGTDKQKARALNALSIDNTLRSLRATRSLTAPVVTTLSAPTGGKRRTIYTAEGTNNLPGKVVRAENDPPSNDDAVDEAFIGLGATFDFFAQIFQRDSIDDEGMPLDAVVHFGNDYNNAFWDGKQMVFGDGDDDLFHRFTIALDIIGHELSHGVVEDEAALMYFNQSGALNESVADVFGCMIAQFIHKQKVDQASWLVGEGLFTKNVKGKALRSLKAPGTAYDDPRLGKDPQPAHMENFVNTFEDNGGVHINSGIPNHAFYTAAMTIGGYAWEKTGRIWYDALRDPTLRPNSGFKRFARITLSHATRLYGADSKEAKAVRDAWKAVGLTIS
jgi:Zn-dependent metalloprotease